MQRRRWIDTRDASETNRVITGRREPPWLIIPPRSTRITFRHLEINLMRGWRFFFFFNHYFILSTEDQVKVDGIITTRITFLKDKAKTSLSCLQLPGWNENSNNTEQAIQAQHLSQWLHIITITLRRNIFLSKWRPDSQNGFSVEQKNNEQNKKCE